MKILALETATEACSAAVLADGVLVERYQVAPREHNRLILPMIEAVLAEAGLTTVDLDALAFGCGPGSFTGVRIAAGVVQGIGLGLDLPVVPVSTLAALSFDALQHARSRRAYACIDARMHEVYWGIYQREPDGSLQPLVDECVCAASAVPVPDRQPGIATGSGWGTYLSELTARAGFAMTEVLPDRFPRAGAIAHLAADQLRRSGSSWPVEQAQPVYLRDNVAQKPGQRG